MKNDDNDQGGLWTVHDIAQTLEVDVSTVRKWTREGRIAPYTKLGGKSGAYLFKTEEVKKLLRRKSCKRCSAIVKRQFLNSDGLCESCIDQLEIPDPEPVETADNGPSAACNPRQVR